MATSTTYTCDRCGKSMVDAIEFLNPIFLEVGARRQMYVDRNVTPTAWWCDRCVNVVGLRRPSVPQENAVTMTLGEQIEEIAKTIVHQVLDERG